MKKILYTLLFFLIPSVVNADAGVPMVFLGLYFSLFLFVPVCLLEIFFLKIKMKVDYKKIVLPVVKSNFVSTIIGYPLSWIVLLVVQLVTVGGNVVMMSDTWSVFKSVVLQAAWLVPFEDKLQWMIPAAGLVGLIPAFFISVWLEYYILKDVVIGHIKFKRTDIQNANLISYMLLFIILLFKLLYNIV
ncbi:hypothetical protein K2P97_12085 [bacterium]|nr:hypothetical protein [bacterium]